MLPFGDYYLKILFRIEILGFSAYPKADGGVYTFETTGLMSEESVAGLAEELVDKVCTIV